MIIFVLMSLLIDLIALIFFIPFGDLGYMVIPSLRKNFSSLRLSSDELYDIYELLIRNFFFIMVTLNDSLFFFCYGSTVLV